jgi:hypothetical protein
MNGERMKRRSVNANQSEFVLKQVRAVGWRLYRSMVFVQDGLIGLQ